MKKQLTFLMEGHPHYNFLEATVSQGLQALGHTVLGANISSQNYCEPHNGEPYDVFLQCVDHARTKPSRGVPTVFIWGDDSGTGKKPKHYPDLSRIHADLIFIRDCRNDKNPRVFPMNFGIEDRFYCAHANGKPKPLADRQYDVTFLGHLATNPMRQRMLQEVQHRLKDSGFKLNIGPRKHETPDSYWSKWVNGYCTHDPEYYAALADSKMILSPMGAGPDCARHWEAMASGGIPLIEGMPTIQVPPALKSKIDCFTFGTAKGVAGIIEFVMKDLVSYQPLADTAFERGKLYHTTKARALYLLDVMHRHKVI